MILIITILSEFEECVSSPPYCEFTTLISISKKHFERGGWISKYFAFSFKMLITEPVERYMHLFIYSYIYMYIYVYMYAQYLLCF